MMGTTEWDFPGAALHRLLEVIAETGDGRILGKAACVSSQWRTTADDKLWKLACAKAQVLSKKRMFVADRLHQPGQQDIARPVTYTRIGRPKAHRTYRETYFSAEGSRSGLSILRFAAAIACGEVDQIVLRPETYFEEAIDISPSSSDDQKRRAVSCVREWALQIREDRGRQLSKGGATWTGQTAGWMAFNRAIRAITPVVVSAVNEQNAPISQRDALEVLKALGCVSSGCGGDLVARFLIDESAIIPALCALFARTMTTQTASSCVAAIITVCCGQADEEPALRDDKDVTLDGLRAVVACGFQEAVQGALTTGDAVAQSATKFTAWARVVLPHAADDLSREFLVCLRVLEQTMSQAPPEALQRATLSEDGVVGQARASCRRHVQMLEGLLEAIEREEDGQALQRVSLRIAHAALPVFAQYCEGCLGPEASTVVSTLVFLAGFEGVKSELAAFSPRFLLSVSHTMSHMAFMRMSEASAWAAVTESFCAWLEAKLNEAEGCKLRLEIKCKRDLHQQLLSAGRGGGAPRETVEQSLTAFLLPGHQAGADAAAVSSEEANALAPKLTDMFRAALHPGPGCKTQIDYHLLKLSKSLVEASPEVRRALLAAGALPTLLQLSIEGDFGVELARVLHRLVRHEDRQAVSAAARKVSVPLLHDVIAWQTQELGTRPESNAAFEEVLQRLEVLRGAAECLVLAEIEGGEAVRPHVGAALTKLGRLWELLGLLAQGGPQHEEAWEILWAETVPGAVISLLPIALALPDSWALWGSHVVQRAVTPAVLVSCLRGSQWCAAAQTAGFAMMHAMVREDQSVLDDFSYEERVSELVAAGAVDAIVEAWRAHTGNQEVVLAAFSAAVILLDVDDDDRKDTVRRPFVEARGVEAVRECQSTHPQDAGMAFMTLRILANVARSLEGCPSDGPDGVLQANPAQTDDTLQLVLVMMRSHPEVDLVQEWACEVLCAAVYMLQTIDLSSTHGHEVVRRGGCVELAIAAMRAFPSNADLQRRACDMLRECGHWELPAQEGEAHPPPTLFQANGGPEVLLAMRRLRDDEAMQRAGIRFMSAHAENSVDASAMILQGVIAEGLEAVRRYRGSDDTNCAVFAMLSNLLASGTGAERASKCRTLVEMGGVEELLASMAFFCEEDVDARARLWVHESAVGVLQRLLRQEVGGRARFDAHGGVDALGRVMQWHVHDQPRLPAADGRFSAALLALVQRLGVAQPQ